MLRLLQLLIFGHVHKWREDKRASLYESHNTEGKLPMGYAVYCTCETCGKPKAFLLRS